MLLQLLLLNLLNAIQQYNQRMSEQNEDFVISQQTQEPAENKSQLLRGQNGSKFELIKLEESSPQRNKSSDKHKIIEQNIKLKQQIFELTQQLQEIMQKDKNRKKKIGAINPSDDDVTLRQKKGELRKQHLEITQLKNKIYSVKRQLEKVYNSRNLIRKQEQLRSLKEELKQLDQEKQGLERIKRQHASNLKNKNNQEQYQMKIQSLKKQFSKVKEEAKAINQKVVQAEKVLRKNHELYIAKQQKLRQLQHRLTAGKQRLKSKKPLPNITPDMIQNLKEQVKQLQQQRRDNQKLWQQKIRAIDIQFQQKKLEQEKKVLILREKQKQYRLNDLKIKELRKLVRHSITSQGKKTDIDLSQFRHKRNIKYLEK